MLAAKRWAAAYYLAGYAVECSLKACILARLAATVGLIFEDRKFSEKCWTHNLEELFRLADLKADFDLARSTDVALNDNWLVLKDWSEASRYRRTPRIKALRLYAAITDKKHGVFSWIKARW